MTYKQYLKSEKWQEKREAVFIRALKNANSTNQHGVCERCGYEPHKPCLQVHHKTYEHVYDELLEELELLCPNCHRAETEKNKQEKAKTVADENNKKSNEQGKLEYEIKNSLGALSDNGTRVHKEFNLISWNGADVIFDLRNWRIEDDGTRKPLKGITLTVNEVMELRRLLDVAEAKFIEQR